MNLISLNETDFLSSDSVCLADRRFDHIQRVLNAQVGQRLRVGLIGGNLGWGQILRITPRQVELKVELNQPAPKPANVEIIMALPRPKSLPRIVQTLTTLGVKRVAFINTWKVEKYYWCSDYTSEKVLNQAMVLGLEQAVDTIPLEMEFYRLFKPFVEDHLNTWTGDCGNSKYLCHPYPIEPNNQDCPGPIVASQTHRNIPLNVTKVLALGPEGGFIDYEVEKFIGQGFKLYSWGPRILKLETALAALVSRFYQPDEV